MNLIAKQTVGSGGASSVTFSNIPQTFTDLKLVVSSRSVRTNDAGGSDGKIQFGNGTIDTGANYTSKLLLNQGGAYSATNSSIFYFTSDNAQTSNTFGSFEAYIPNYTSSNAKSVSLDAVTENNSSTAYAVLTAGLWTGTSAINIMTITDNNGGFTEFSTFYLYGISNSTTTQNGTTPYATGGDVIATDGTYWYHTFLYSGTFTPLQNLTCDYLVVAGGGGGAGGYSSNAKGGAGGAGGLRSTVTATGGGGSLESPLSLTANTAYTATVGASGAGATGDNNPSIGNNSYFSTITSNGGGGGGFFTGSATNGGSGGGGGPGGGAGSTSGGLGTANQGYNGGTGQFYTNNTSGGGAGGGGAGGAGSNATSNGQGNGGVGVSSSISGSSVSYAGGGGGGAAITAGTASAGGGAGGLGNSNGTAGTANTGGGGGGGGSNSNTTTGGNGGSGIIVVRYAV